jgi:hypothetical protein
MKKTIKIQLKKLEDLKERKDGTLQGGFASLKGGFQSDLLTTNDHPGGCTNTKDCTKTTNAWGCVNSGICFI